MQKLPKGSLIRVEGKLRAKEWTEKNTGDKRKAFAVVATALQRVRAAEPAASPQQSYYSDNYHAAVSGRPRLQASPAHKASPDLKKLPTLSADEGQHRRVGKGMTEELHPLPD